MVVDYLSLASHAGTATADHVINHQHNADLVAFYHATLGSPPIASLIKALSRGYLRTLPRLTAKLASSNKPVSIATAKGHLDMTRLAVCST